MLKEINELQELHAPVQAELAPKKVRISHNIRSIFSINKQNFDSIFAQHILQLLSKDKEVIIVASKSKIAKVAQILKENSLFTYIDSKQLTISAHNLNSKTGFYFQKVVFFDADNILHCDLAIAERRQVRDFIIKTQQTDLEIDLLSTQPLYEGLSN